MEARLHRLAIVADPRRTALVAGMVILALGTLGAVQDPGLLPGPLDHAFDLDGEGNVPAAWSAVLLFAAGGLAFLVGRTGDERSVRRRWLALGAFLAFMGLDEGLTIHERISQLFGGYNWERLYAPVALVGGLAWAAVLKRVWPFVRERALLVGGAALWLVAEVLEEVEAGPHGRVEGYSALATGEEMLEMTGSLLFGLAILHALRRLDARRAPATVPAPAVARAPREPTAVS